MTSQHDSPQMHHRWKLLVASLLTVGVVGSAWAGDGDGERIRIEKKVVHSPCSAEGGAGPFGGGEVQSRGFLGVELTQLTADLRRHFGVPEDVGVMIGKVVDDSAAFRSGLVVGDIITAADGREVDGPWELTSAIRGKKGGEALDLEYWRDGRLNQVTVMLDEKEGCVFDLGSVMHSLEGLGENWPEIQMEALELSGEAMEQAMEALKNIDWGQQLEALEDLEIDLQMEEQMEELKIQMEELEKRLSMESEHVQRELRESLKDKERVLRDQRKAQIKAEKAARKEMIRAQEEARRAMEEARQAQAEKVREMREEQRRQVEEVRREAEEMHREAMEEAEEQAREAEEAALEAAEEDGYHVEI